MPFVPSRSRGPGAVVRAKRRRRVALAVVVAALALVGAACEQLNPDNRAASVPMVTNGALPLSYLASTPNGCVVYDEALASLNDMVAVAAKNGVKLRGASCYRDYAGQVAARDDWCSRGACQMAAVPGTSNHGWGKAVDFVDQTGELDWDSPGYLWLKQFGAAWGWIHPAVMEPGGAAPEPWHWEWIGDGGKMFLGQYFGTGNGPLAVPRGQPMGNLGAVKGNRGTVTVTGWAIDPDQVASIPVHVYVDDAMAPIMANLVRKDVAKKYPLYGTRHGYSATLGATPGPHTVCAYAINMSGTGTNKRLGCKVVQVAAPLTVQAASSYGTNPAPTTTVPASTSTSITDPPVEQHHGSRTAVDDPMM